MWLRDYKHINKYIGEPIAYDFGEVRVARRTWRCVCVMTILVIIYSTAICFCLVFISTSCVFMKEYCYCFDRKF